jgi:hypothetical protein
MASGESNCPDVQRLVRHVALLALFADFIFERCARTRKPRSIDRSAERSEHTLCVLTFDRFVQPREQFAVGGDRLNVAHRNDFDELAVLVHDRDRVDVAIYPRAHATQHTPTPHNGGERKRIVRDIEEKRMSAMSAMSVYAPIISLKALMARSVSSMQTTLRFEGIMSLTCTFFASLHTTRGRVTHRRANTTDYCAAREHAAGEQQATDGFLSRLTKTHPMIIDSVNTPTTFWFCVMANRRSSPRVIVSMAVSKEKSFDSSTGHHASFSTPSAGHGQASRHNEGKSDQRSPPKRHAQGTVGLPISCLAVDSLNFSTFFMKSRSSTLSGDRPKSCTMKRMRFICARGEGHERFSTPASAVPCAHNRRESRGATVSYQIEEAVDLAFGVHTHSGADVLCHQLPTRTNRIQHTRTTRQESERASVS